MAVATAAQQLDLMDFEVMAGAVLHERDQPSLQPPEEVTEENLVQHCQVHF